LSGSELGLDRADGGRDRQCMRTSVTFIGLSLACLLASGCGRSTRPSMTPPDRPGIEIQGHRGCRGLRPENTMAAFHHAARLGVDVLELDLGLSKDGVLVVAHDPEVNSARCAGAERLPAQLLRDLTWDQLRSLDCGAKENPRFPAQILVPGERMPRLEQIFDLLRSRPKLRVNIEIKTGPDTRHKTRPPADFAEVLVKLINARGLQARVVVQSFDRAALQAVARLAPELPLAALVERRAEIAPMLRATRAKIISPRHTEIDAASVRALQARGLRVIPWTVNEPADMRRLVSWGVDGIITDRPDLLLRLLER